MKNRIIKIKQKISFRLRKKIDKKIIIIESDDWGLERASDSIAINSVVKKYGVENCSRWTFDALESVQDLDYIYQLFDNYNNHFQKPPIITANFITHNIDYSESSQLKFKPISSGYNFGEPSIFEKYKEGINKNYFKPQLHGFSHYNTTLLQKDFDSINFKDDFNLGFPLAKSTIKGNLDLYRAECFDPNFEINFQKANEVFFDTFGYHSKTFIPPNYLYSDLLNPIITNSGVELLQASSHFLNQEKSKPIRPFFRKNKGLQYSIRNARLDVHKDYNYLSNHCIQQINTAFSLQMPAIIDIHRVNFAGKYDIETRYKTIDELNKVLLYLSKHHSDVVFMTSDEFNEFLK